MCSQNSIGAELNVAWNLYADSSARCKNVEAEKRAKLEIQRGIMTRKKEKEKEPDELELEISDDNVRLINQNKNNLSVEAERLSKQLKGEFDTKIKRKAA